MNRMKLGGLFNDVIFVSIINTLEFSGFLEHSSLVLFPLCAPDSGCSSGVTSSGEWLQKNLGGFSALVSFRDLQTLYSNFSAVLDTRLVSLSYFFSFSSPSAFLNPVFARADVGLTAADRQTAGGCVRHARPARLPRPGDGGDETRARPIAARLLR